MPKETRAEDVIVFTDLDGTLLDHQSYEYGPARQTLGRLRRLNVPLVLASSKTAAEMIPLREELGLAQWPMICENGAGAVGPGGPASQQRAEYVRLRRALDDLPRTLRRPFEGFGDMGPERIAQVTGLSIVAARLAAQRQFSEPGLWTGADPTLQGFLSLLQDKGIFARRGGRFLTLSYGASKADQMRGIVERLGKRVIIALGDAPNDAEMLASAQYAIILPNERGTAMSDLGTSAAEQIRAAAPGPEGWNDSLGTLLTRLGLPR